MSGEVVKGPRFYGGAVQVSGVGVAVQITPDATRGEVRVLVPGVPVLSVELEGKGIKSGSALLKTASAGGVVGSLAVKKGASQGVLLGQLALTLPNGTKVSQPVTLTADAPIPAGPLDYDGDGDVDWEDAKRGAPVVAKRHPLAVIGLLGGLGFAGYKVARMMWGR